MTVHADDDTRSPVRGGAGTRPRTLLGGVLGLFVVAILAASVAGRPSVLGSAGSASPRPQETVPTPSADATPREPVDRDPDVVLLIIGIVLALIAITLIISLVIVLLRRLLTAWRDRPLRRRTAVDTGFDAGHADAPAAPDPDAPAMRRGIAAARVAVDAHPDPSDAIVAAWLGLEETATDSGVGRAISETQVEFTLRILLRRPGIDEPARRLLRLYEGVRFAGRSADEQQRAEAAQALALIEEGWR